MPVRKKRSAATVKGRKRGKNRPLSVRAREARARADALEKRVAAEIALQEAKEALRQARARG